MDLATWPGCGAMQLEGRGLMSQRLQFLKYLAGLATTGHLAPAQDVAEVLAVAGARAGHVCP